MTETSSSKKAVVAPVFIPFLFLFGAACGWLCVFLWREQSFGASLVTWGTLFVSPLLGGALAIAYYPERSTSRIHKWAFAGCAMYSSLVIVTVAFLMVYSSLHHS